MKKIRPPRLYKSLDVRGEHSDEQIKAFSRHQLIYAIIGLLLGLVCIVGGIYLFISGVTGNISWTANFLGAQSEMLNAAPGAILFVVGLFIVYITRLKIKSKRK